MPYINLSTLTYPATNSFPGGTWEDTRNPTSNDYRNFHIGVTWINFKNKSVWFMVDKTATSGTWIQAAINASGILDITGNNGGPVGPDLSNNINLFGTGTLLVSGSPGTNTLTISQNGTVATSYVEDAGSAIPSGGILNIIGGTGVNTSGAGHTVTINALASVPLQFTEDAGTAVPLANNLNVFGGTGISTSGAGHTVTVSVSGSIADLYTEDVGTATPSGNNLNIKGGTGIATSGAGSTVTITALATVPLLFTENSGTATPSANNLNILGASGITTSGAGSTVTISPGSTLATLYTEDTGTAAPSGNNLNVIGGTGIATSGAGSTITISTSGVVATEYDEDAGSAIPSLGKLKIVGGTGISTSGAGNTVTITNTSSSALTFQEDSGTATPAAGVIMIRGGAGISTSGAGSTVTITNNIPYSPSGSFTPTMTFGGASVGITYTSQNGFYTRIGNIIFYQLSVILSSKGSSTGVANVGGLPVASAGPNTISGNPQLGSVTFSGFVNFFTQSGTTNAVIEQTTSGAGYMSLTDANFTNTSSISVAGFYFTA